ncbi:MAG: SBBP repeat-containing protein, partial [Planctomycetota bacterium]
MRPLLLILVSLLSIRPCQADGGAEQASKSPLAQIVYCDPNIPGDVDENCQVDFRDVAVLGRNWFDVGLEPNILQEWVARYDGPDNQSDTACAIAIDSNNNICVTGFSYGSGTWDYATIKYGPDSNEPIWVARYNGPGNYTDAAYAIATDSNNSIYVTGYSYGSGTWDYATIKYGPYSSEPIWVARYNGPGNGTDVAYGIAIDSNNNIYVTGWSESSGTGVDYATIKYGPDSNEPIWVARYNGPG